MVKVVRTVIKQCRRTNQEEFLQSEEREMWKKSRTISTIIPLTPTTLCSSSSCISTIPNHTMYPPPMTYHAGVRSKRHNFLREKGFFSPLPESLTKCLAKLPNTIWWLECSHDQFGILHLKVTIRMCGVHIIWTLLASIQMNVDR